MNAPELDARTRLLNAGGGDVKEPLNWDRVAPLLRLLARISLRISASPAVSGRDCRATDEERPRTG